MNLLQAIFSHKWMMNAPALHALINIVSKITDDPVSIAKAFHGTQFQNYLTEDNQPKKHSLLDSMDYPMMDNTYGVRQINNVAILPVIGAIFPRASSVPMSYGANVKLDRFNHDFMTALNNSTIDTIIKIYDGPGGEVTGVSESSQLVFNARSKKKIISYVYGMAASADYWMASSAEEIWASNTAEVGSIGVVASYTDYSEYDSKKGIKRHEIVSDLSPNKRPNLNTEEGRAGIQKVVNDLAFVFVETVAKQMNVGFQQVMEKFGQGSMFVAKEALERGMIHKISTLDELINSVKINKNSTFSGGLPMTLQEMQAQDPEGYKALMDEAAKVASGQVADKHAAEVASAKEAGKKEGLSEAEEASKAAEAAEEARQKAELDKSNQKLSTALQGVGVTAPKAGDEVDEEAFNSFVNTAATAMNERRHFA